jgi:hypothetical protein
MRDEASSNEVVSSGAPEPSRSDAGRTPTQTTKASSLQSFREIVQKARELANDAYDFGFLNVRKDRGYEWRPLRQYIDSLPDRRFEQLRAFLAWGAEGSDWSEPEIDIKGFVARFTRRIARWPMLRTMWNEALIRPRDVRNDARHALYHAKRLGIDIESVFPDCTER